MEIKVQYWYQNNDDYDFDILNVEANSDEEAIQKVKEGEGYFKKGYPEKPRRGAKDFKVI